MFYDCRKAFDSSRHHFMDLFCILCGKLDNQQAKRIRRVESPECLPLARRALVRRHINNFPISPKRRSDVRTKKARLHTALPIEISITHMQLIPGRKIASPAAFQMRKHREFIAKLKLKMRYRFIIAAFQLFSMKITSSELCFRSCLPPATKETR